MNSEKYNQIIDEAYENYMNNWPSKIPRIGPCLKEEFINKIKTNDEFSKTWDLKMEERELSQKERYDWYIQTHNKNLTRFSNQFDTDDILNSNNCPTKLITVTYKKEKIEVYE